MPRRAKRMSKPEPLMLPPIPGPKLHPFDTGGAPLDIDFLEELGVGGDSLNYRAHINGKIYAVKLFTFSVLRQGYWQATQLKWTQDEHMYYEHPFYNECRVFGRLKETGNELLSVKCYGYLLLGDEYKKQLLKDWAVTEKKWRYDDNYAVDWGEDPKKLPAYRSQKNDPIMAIVKDLLPLECTERIAGFKEYEQPSLQVRELPGIIRGIHAFHKLGIQLVDIAERNYFEGKMFDFSRAITKPHPHLTLEYIKARQCDDEGNFMGADGPIIDYLRVDEMIEDMERFSGKRIWLRMEANFRYKRKLRPRASRSPQRHELYARYRPELYEWQQHL